jgi:hypothetical protein
MTTGLRQCSKCGGLKLPSEYHKQSRGKDGLRADCKACRFIVKLKEILPVGMKRCVSCHDVKDLSHFLAKQGACYACRKERIAAYSLANREKCNQIKKDWAKNNSQKHAASCAKWAKNNRSKLNGKDSARRAMELQAVPSWLTAIQKAQIQEMYDVALAVSMQTGIPHEVDHVHPLKGDTFNGLHVPWNLQIIPQFENRSKGCKLPNSDAHLAWGVGK